MPSHDELLVAAQIPPTGRQKLGNKQGKRVRLPQQQQLTAPRVSFSHTTWNLPPVAASTKMRPWG